MMLNFDKGTELPSKYLGAEKKTAILYEGERYMLKLSHPLENKAVRPFEGAASYKNNQYSEYIGSSIFRACGIEAQEAFLGHYTDDAGKHKIVVGCKDFTQDGGTLYEFSALKNNSYNVRSCYSIKGKRIAYHEIFKAPPADRAAAIRRVVPKIDMGKIHEIVDATPEMSDVRKQYLKAALDLRYKEILQPALKRVLQQEQEQERTPTLSELLKENAKKAEEHNSSLPPPPKSTDEFER